MSSKTTTSSNPAHLLCTTTSPDILPLPTHFSRDTNLPAPARRTRVDEFPLVVGSSRRGGSDRRRGRRGREAQEDEDVEHETGWFGRKVRMYGRVVSYIESKSILILSDPDSPASTSTSHKPPRPMPTIKINTSLLSSHLYPFSSSSVVDRPHSRSTEDDSDSDPDPDEVRVRVGSAVDPRLARVIRGIRRGGGKSNGSTLRASTGERKVQGIKLDPGQAVEVVGWVERGSASEECQGEWDWVIRAIHLFNVGGYVSLPERSRGVGEVEKGADGWERRKGLEVWD